MCRTDRDCVRRCLDGHPEAFRRLVVRYQGPLVRYLAGRLGDEEEAIEAAQETLVRAYFRLEKLKKPDSFYSWLLGIAGRVAKETHRARRRQVVSLDDQTVPDRRQTTAQRQGRPDPAVGRAIAQLPEVYRQVVLLRFYGGLSCAEVSRDLGVPLGTVTKRLSRAYALLRESLRKRGQQEDDVEVRP